jgi:hypothetical protein
MKRSATQQPSQAITWIIGDLRWAPSRPHKATAPACSQRVPSPRRPETLGVIPTGQGLRTEDDRVVTFGSELLTQKGDSSHKDLNDIPFPCIQSKPCTLHAQRHRSTATRHPETAFVVDSTHNGDSIHKVSVNSSYGAETLTTKEFLTLRKIAVRASSVRRIPPQRNWRDRSLSF